MPVENRFQLLFLINLYFCLR